MNNRPKIVCLCGSTRFIDQMAVQAWLFEQQGKIALSCHLLPDWYCPVEDHFAEHQGVADAMDELHFRKIDLSDEVFIVNPGGYIGNSTRNEIAYAKSTGKPVTFLESIETNEETMQ